MVLGLPGQLGTEEEAILEKKRRGEARILPGISFRAFPDSKTTNKGRRYPSRKQQLCGWNLSRDLSRTEVLRREWC